MLIKVAAYQGRMGEKLTLEEKIYIFKQRPDFLCLPEYFMLDDSVDDYHRAALNKNEYLKYLSSLSDELSTCLIAGTVVEPEGEKLYNTSYVINRGGIIGRYRKRFPVERERERGISPGEDLFLVNVEGVKIGLMVCGDVFHRDLYEEMHTHGADVIFIPTTSAYRPDDSLTKKRFRDREFFLDGAEAAGAFVVKVCGVGKIFGHPLQGRSLIAAPWGMLCQTDTNGEQVKRILTATLDIGEVRDFRKKYRRKNHHKHEQTEILL
jgi:predicted amidohydrolase